MLDFFKFKSTPLVGVDISSSSIKVLELSRINGKYTVENYGVELLPPGSVVEKNIKDVSQVATGIRKVVNRIGINRKFTAIAVAGASVLNRIIQMNVEFNDAEIEEQIEVEADRYIPYPLEEVYYDFEVLGPSLKNPNLMDILLAASRIETLDSRVAAVNEAGLRVTIVDIETLVIERAFSLIAHHLPGQGIGSTVAFVDLGATDTTFYVFRDLHIIYNRDEAFGGKHLTDEIQKRYGLSEEEAIAAQKYGGLPEDYTAEVLEPFKETIVQHISRSLQVFFSSGEESEVHHIVLAGGVAMLPGLERLIQEKLSIKTLVANPFSDMQISNKVNRNTLFEDAPGLMMACGLALRTFDNE